MAEEETNPVGRPPIEIDYDLCEKLARVLCTQAEIAAILGVSLSTLEHDKEFLRIHKRGLEVGKASLRRMQYKAAEEGNSTMLVWLGKQYLGQRDKRDTEITGKDGDPIQVVSNMSDEEVISRARRILDTRPGNTS